MQRALASATVFLALLGIGFSVEHLLDDEHYNPGFVEHPWLMRGHVTLGAAYLALALPQFVATLRRSRPQVHRLAGRTAVAAGLAAGATALVITVWFPFSGPLEIVVVAPFAGLFVFALGRGLWLARRRRIAEHREWMIRALAIATSIATMRLLFVPLLFAGEVSDERARWLSLTSFAAAFLLHATVAEAWVRATRGGRAPLAHPLAAPPPASGPP
jgi:uncharacterized membrane protein YozB (DUF420 family)